jgi:UDP-glucose 4-epimerase
MGDYFKVSADKRDLNYRVYVEEGDTTQTEYTDYDSHTTTRLTVTEVEELLLTLPEVREELSKAGVGRDRAVVA